MQQVVGIPEDGHLRLHLIECQGLRDISGLFGFGLFGTMSPYVHIHVGKWQDWRSPVCKNGGTNPKWNETNFFDIEVKHRTQMARIEVRD